MLPSRVPCFTPGIRFPRSGRKLYHNVILFFTVSAIKSMTESEKRHLEDSATVNKIRPPLERRHLQIIGWLPCKLHINSHRFDGMYFSPRYQKHRVQIQHYWIVSNNSSTFAFKHLHSWQIYIEMICMRRGEEGRDQRRKIKN